MFSFSKFTQIPVLLFGVRREHGANLLRHVRWQVVEGVDILRGDVSGWEVDTRGGLSP